MTRPGRLAVFYRTLAELLDAGIPVAAAMAQAEATAGLAQALDFQIAQGATLAQALGSASAVFPPADVGLIATGEQTGRVDQVLRQLSNLASLNDRLQRQLLAGLVLPAAVFHLVAIIGPLPAWLAGGSLAGYLASSFGFVAGIWLVLGLGVAGLRLLPAAILDRWLRSLPWLGEFWRELIFLRFVTGMEIFTGAGVSIFAALRGCAKASRSPHLATILRRAADTAEAKREPVSIALAAAGEFPTDVVIRWKNGERTGQLDTVFAQLSRSSAARVEARAKALAAWVPRVIYAIVGLYVVAQILHGASVVSASRFDGIH